MTAGQIGFKIEIIVEPDDEGFYAYCPALEGLHTCGDTESEAIQNARDAVIAYLGSLIKHNDPIPLGILNRERAHTVSREPKYKTSYEEDIAVAV